MARVNTKIDGVDAFATNDLIEEHPAKPGHWAIIGRLDDQIVLSNGEKVRLRAPFPPAVLTCLLQTNPVPLGTDSLCHAPLTPYLMSRNTENIINQDPHVRHCLIFGHGRFQNGVLIDPKPDLQFDIEDSKALEEFRNRVWLVFPPSLCCAVHSSPAQADNRASECIRTSAFSHLQGGAF